MPDQETTREILTRAKTPWYNDSKAIASELDTLHDLHRLAKARHEAGYDRREQLDEFLVLGRFWLDRCGNFMHTKLEWEGGQDLGFLVKGLPEVVHRDDLFAFLGKLSISSTFRSLPTSEDLCPECGEGWSLETCSDAQAERDDQDVRVFRHRYCVEIAEERAASQRYREIADAAGFTGFLLVPTPNEYMKEGAPWVKIRTPRGDITFGWRKSVICIDWSDVRDRASAGKKYEESRHLSRVWVAETIFPKENVTKEGPMIHAWGKEKAAEYLRVLGSMLKLPSHSA